MIRVTLCRTGTAFALHARGHAGFAPRGRDVLCAAVSALTDTLLMCLERAQEEGALELLQYEAQDGYLHILCIPKAARRSLFEWYGFVRTGLGALRTCYPDLIQIWEDTDVPIAQAQAELESQ